MLAKAITAVLDNMMVLSGHQSSRDGIAKDVKIDPTPKLPRVSATKHSARCNSART
ncbi:MAG: hypothetical protein AAF496_17185 [Pseudomonadota bacterium]